MNQKNIYPHILILFGTRPEFIKMVPIIAALKNTSIPCTICNTAQHKEMLNNMLKVFNVKPDYDLKIMLDNQTLTQVSTRILEKLGTVLVEIKPDIVLVQGDTTTTFISSLAAYYQKIKIGHVEAGLRTKNKYNPFPEEINRRLTSVIADFHFAPTSLARQNLISEGIEKNSIFVTGNTVVDTLFLVLEMLEQKQVNISNDIKQFIDQNHESYIVLITAHRRENFGVPLVNICLAIKKLAIKYQEMRFIYPVHLNPNVQSTVNNILKGIKNVKLTIPSDYFSFIYLMKHCHLILTDSGGIQEEAPSLGKPVLVLRETTERPEGVTSGVVKLIGTSEESIIKEASTLLDNKLEYERMAVKENPYGDGKASQRIVDILLSQ
jgi:UDP-N-acetylglucosamine 2-epimerase